MTIVPRHYEDLETLHESTLPPRAYYLPASTAITPGPRAPRVLRPRSLSSTASGPSPTTRASTT